MSPNAPPPPRLPPETNEGRDALFTFLPAIMVAFVLDWALTTQWGWTSQRSLITSIVAGIAVALVLQRAIARARRR